MNELSAQDKGVRTTTILIDSMISCLANRSHSQGIIVKEDALVKFCIRMVTRQKTIEILWNCFKRGKIDFALITTHAKHGIIVSGARKAFSFPMKGMAGRAFNVHPSKAVNLPSRVKWLVSNGILWWLWLWQWW